MQDVSPDLPMPDVSPRVPTVRIRALISMSQIRGQIRGRLHHNTPRVQLFVPTDENSPIPVQYLDILRTTKTDLEDSLEVNTKDFWTKDGNRSLSSEWTGETMFRILRPIPPPNHEWVDGRLTKMQKTTRPASCWPETWKTLSKKQKQVEIDEWSKEKAERDAERARSGKWEHIPVDLEDDYAKMLAEAMLQHAVPEAAAMPIIEAQPAKRRKRGGKNTPKGVAASAGRESLRQHQDHIAPAGNASAEWFACVHTLIPMKLSLIHI